MKDKHFDSVYILILWITRVLTQSKPSSIVVVYKEVANSVAQHDGLIANASLVTKPGLQLANAH